MKKMNENESHVIASVAANFFLNQVINPIEEKEPKHYLLYEAAQQRVENRIDTLKLPFALLGDKAAKLAIQILAKETKIDVAEILPWRNLVLFEDIAMFFKKETENIYDIFPDNTITITNAQQAKDAFLLEYGSMALGEFHFDKVEQIIIKDTEMSAFATINGAKTGIYVVPIDGATPFIESPDNVEFINLYIRCNSSEATMPQIIE